MGIAQMRVLILGADGYLGWPTYQYLLSKDHTVIGIDNYAKRRWELEFNAQPLWPMTSQGKTLQYCDLLNARRIYQVLEEFGPEVIIHYAEQPSAPMSMAGREYAVDTQINNVIGTLNLLFGMMKHCPNAHLIKLGSMGEYGTPNIDIEEGWLTVQHKGRTDTVPFPKQPGSFYHLSKVHDTHNIAFACKTWGIRATDLNQGIVYGVRTKDTSPLSFHYDAVFGTVLNRFVVQAANSLPLTVYGEGKQIRTFLNIEDTLQCVEIAMHNPPKAGEFVVRNQFTEKFSIVELAQMVKHASPIPVCIQKIPNPRAEVEGHYYNPSNQSFLDLGLKPHLLADDILIHMITTVATTPEAIINYFDPYNPSVITPNVRWKE
jgi:UDP-sulfoquinovose synthase